MHIGELIKMLRTDNNMTQEELGKVLGIKKSAVQKYESGAVKNLRADTIKKLCVYFHVVPWVFIFSEEFAEYVDKNYKMTESHLFTFFFDSYHEIGFFSRYGALTEKARVKVNDYVDDLAKIEEYRSPFGLH